MNFVESVVKKKQQRTASRNIYIIFVLHVSCNVRKSGTIYNFLDEKEGNFAKGEHYIIWPVLNN